MQCLRISSPRWLEHAVSSLDCQDIEGAWARHHPQLVIALPKVLCLSAILAVMLKLTSQRVKRGGCLTRLDAISVLCQSLRYRVDQVYLDRFELEMCRFAGPKLSSIATRMKIILSLFCKVRSEAQGSRVRAFCSACGHSHTPSERLPSKLWSVCLSAVGVF